MHTVTRYHDISAGHRVVGHEGHCQFLHGHNYRIHFTVAAFGANSNEDTHTELDKVGRVLDFGVIKSRLCLWIESYWDHRLLIWSGDPWYATLGTLDSSIRRVPFNPTAENMAQYLVDVVGPDQLSNTGVELIEVTVEETRKCSATYRKVP